MKENLVKLLDSMILILDREKEALIKDNVDELNKIVDEKNIFVDELSKFKGKNYGESKEVLDIIKKINEKQEINMILAKQAVNYNDVFLNSLKKATENKEIGYSKDGKFSKTRSNSIIDKTV